jgi:hypothetical protein
VASTSESSKCLDGNNPPPSGQDVAAVSLTPIESRLSKSYPPPTRENLFGDVSKDLALWILCKSLESLVYETCSPDKLFLAFHRVKDVIDKLPKETDRKEAEEIFNRLIVLMDRTSKKNPLKILYE